VLTRRGSWGIADQSAIALSNFCAGVIIARSSGPAGLGVFALAYATVQILVGLQRACCLDPWLIVRGRDRHAGFGSLVRPLFGVYGLVASFGLLTAVLAGRPILTLTVVAAIPVLAQDVGRAALLASSGARAVVLNDTATGVVQVAVTLALAAYGGVGGVAGLGVGSLVGSALCGRLLWTLAGAHVHPNVSDLWVIGKWFTVDSLVFIGTFQMIPFCVAAVAGKDAVGIYQGYLTLFRPLALLGVGLASVWFVELARASSDPFVLKAYAREGIRVMAVAAFYTAIVVAVSPWVVRVVFGDDFNTSSIWGTAVLGTGALAQLGFMLRLAVARAAGLGRTVVVARATAGTFTLLVILLAGTGSLWSIGLGMCLGNLVGSLGLRVGTPVATATSPDSVRSNA
jgi:O-antigen/teichoic acid export membrane protein